MRFNRKKNVKNGTIIGTINKLIVMLVPFLIRSIIIKRLGSDYLGLNGLFTSILNTLNLAELGFSSAIIYSLYKSIAEDDTNTICALMNYYKKVYRIIGIVVVACGVAVMPFLQYLIKGNYPDDINLYLLFAIYLLNTALAYFLFAYKNCLLLAHQRYDISMIVSIVISILQYSVQILLLLLFSNYYLYIICLPIFTIFGNIGRMLIVRKMYPNYISKGKLSKNMRNSIRTKIKGLAIYKICGVTRNTFDAIFISIFLGLTMVAIYDNYYYIMTAIVGFLYIIIDSLRAGIGNSIARNSVETNYKEFNNIMFCYMWIAGLCTICLFCLYQPFMKWWVGKSLMLNMDSVILFCAYFYTLTIGDIKAMYIDASGLWWENRYRSIIESVLNLILNYFLGICWGINGIIASTMISLLLINFGYGSTILYRYYFKKQKLLSYYLWHLKYALVTAVACGLTYGCCILLPVTGIACIILRGIICLIVPNIIYILCYVKDERFAYAKGLIFSLFKIQCKVLQK